MRFSFPEMRTSSVNRSYLSSGVVRRGSTESRMIFCRGNASIEMRTAPRSINNDKCYPVKINENCGFASIVDRVESGATRGAFRGLPRRSSQPNGAGPLAG